MTTKSKILKQLSDNWPNFRKNDMSRLIEICLKEIKLALKRGDRVELRSSLGVFYTKTQKARFSLNPKTSEKVYTESKKTINFKCSKEVFKKMNNDK